MFYRGATSVFDEMMGGMESWGGVAMLAQQGVLGLIGLGLGICVSN